MTEKRAQVGQNSNDQAFIDGAAEELWVKNLSKVTTQYCSQIM